MSQFLTKFKKRSVEMTAREPINLFKINNLAIEVLILNEF